MDHWLLLVIYSPLRPNLLILLYNCELPISIGAGPMGIGRTPAAPGGVVVSDKLWILLGNGGFVLQFV